MESSASSASSSGSMNAAACVKRNSACVTSEAAYSAPASAAALTAISTRAMTPRLRKSGSASGKTFCLILDMVRQ